MLLRVNVVAVCRPRVNTRDLSKERDAYYKTKSTLDVADPAQLEELKKALMRRAMFTIPMILNLQQQGKSVDRLYGRGMLTDEIMANVKNLKEFVDAEFPDVQAEADDIIHGWGPAIWQEAMQFHRMVQQHNTAEQGKGQGQGEAGGGAGTSTGPLNRDAKDKKTAAAERRRKNAANLQLSPADLLKKKEAEAEKMASQLLLVNMMTPSFLHPLPPSLFPSLIMLNALDNSPNYCLSCNILFSFPLS